VERKKRQQYGNEFRQQAVERTNACGNIVGLARELGICRRALYNWRERVEETDSPPGRTRELILRRQILRLKRLLANKTLEVDFFQTCLAKSRSSTLPEVRLWRHRIYDEIRARLRLQGTLSVERMCQLTQVRRAGFYRYLRRGWQQNQGVAKSPQCVIPHDSIDFALAVRYT
jgi:transposase-like protein